MDWVRQLDTHLSDGSDVLELGCGRGVPATRELARRHRVTGVDISAVQIELARHHVPEASFVHGDAMELEIAPASLDAVVALFVFGHVPVEEQPGLIARIALWLRDGGLFLGTFSSGERRGGRGRRLARCADVLRVARRRCVRAAAARGGVRRVP